MKFSYSYRNASVTLAAATDADLLDNSTSGCSFKGADVVHIAIKNLDVSNAIDTITLSYSPSGGLFAPFSGTYSIAASSTKHFELKGFAGTLRVIANSTSGASAQVDVAGFVSGQSLPYQLVVDGVSQGTGTGGTISGNLAQTAGTFSLAGNGNSSISTSSGTITIDPATTLSLGPTTATAVAVGRAAVAPSFPGGLTVAAGKAINGGAGALTVDTTGALSLGPTNATSVAIGSASVADSHPGGLTIASGKAVTGAGAMAVEATGALTVAGAASTTSSLIGRIGNVTTMVGDVLFNNLFRAVVADAGAAGASGTANASFGTFTVASGQSGYVLTNSKIAATSLLFCTCISGAVARSVFSFIPTSNTGTLLLSGAAGADSVFAFMVVNV